MSKLARTIPVVAIAATALMAVPSGATAATTIGQVFTPTGNTCGANFTRLQTVSPAPATGAPQYAAPTDGVITQWNFQAPATTSAMRFKVGRATGNTNEFTVIGQSDPPVVPVANVLNSYFTRISVKAGDIIGSYTTAASSCTRPQADYSYRFINGDVQPPTTAVFPNGFNNVQIDVSASLEPDCDNDGFGDETQDPDISSCAPPPPGTGIPPPGSPPGTPPVTCRGVNATIVGTNGSDVRTGSLGRDVIAGLGGNDTLSGIAGNDLICGGAGKDLEKGGKGKDTLLGQKGKDTLRGGGAKDKCIGGKGNDTASKCEVEKSI
jgi:Ca2+-binding RTX toxin-like protein